METLQNVWTALTTTNPDLCNILAAPFILVEAIVGMLLFTTLLDIHATKKQKIIYVILLSIWTMVSNYLIPKPYGLYLNMIIGPIIVYFVLKTTIIKSIASIILIFLSSAIFETIFGKLYYTIFSVSYDVLAAIPMFRISLASLIYISTYFVYRTSKKFNLNFNFINFNIIRDSSKRLLIINFLLGILAIATQSYLIVFYNAVLPFGIVIATSISLITYLIISIYSLLKTSKLEETSQILEQEKLYNKTLDLLHDKTKAFRHDFGNILQAIGGYVDSGDLNGLKIYYKDLNKEFVDSNNLSALSPKVINNPAIYSILAAKYYEADKDDIKINFEIFFNLSTLNMKTFQFTRILGIFLDNAIYAAKECDERIVNVTIRNDFKVRRQILVIENTYKNKDVDTEKIFEKGYSSKSKNDEKPTGMGLWEVRQILRRNKNLNLFTTKNDNFFIQQLEIY